MKTAWLITFNDYDPVGVWLDRKIAVKYLVEEMGCIYNSDKTDNIFNSDHGRYIIIAIDFYG